MSKHIHWSRIAVVLGLSGIAALAPHPASARYIALQCGRGGLDIYTDAKYIVMRPDGDSPAGLFEHSVITDDVFQGDRTTTDGKILLMVIDRKTALLRVSQDGTVMGADRCTLRSATTPASSVPPSGDSANGQTGNKF